MKYALVLAALGTIVAVSIPRAAQAEGEPATSAAPAPATASEVVGTSRAFVICGLTGDEDHRKLFAETLERLYAGLTSHHGFAPENVVVLWGDEPTEADGAAVRSSRGLSNKETIASAIGELAASVQASDRLWLFVLGHAHYDNRYSWLNLPGPDLQHVEFGKLLSGIRCREQAFFITTPASGFYHKSLAAPGRIVITATEPDLEVNETLFPHHLARTLAEPPAFRELDLDEDGLLTLLDLYLWTAQQTAQEYATNMLLATEHALLDDSGDGRATEVQADYLTEELGGRRRPGQPAAAPRTTDGALARQVRLRYPPSPPAPVATGEGS